MAASTASSMLPFALGTGAMLAVAVAYAITVNMSGIRFPRGDTGQAAVWAGIFAAAGLIIALMTQHPAFASRPRLRAALRGFLPLAAVFVSVGFVSLCALGRAHSAVWSGIASLVLAASAVHVLAGLRRVPEQSPSTDVSPGLDSAEKGGKNLLSEGQATRAQRCARGCGDCIMWTLLPLLALVVVSFGVGTALTASEAARFKAPGKFYKLAAAPGSEKTVFVHMYCTGTRASASRPVIIFESGGGACGFSFFGVQQLLAQSGIRSCAYDRPGFGWSEGLPLGWSSVTSYNHIATSLLAASGEAAPYIFVGHSAGVELSQIYAYFNPSQVVGLSLLDGYPNYLKLLGYSPALVASEVSRICSILQTARSFEAVGLIRPVYAAPSKFQPKDQEQRMRSTYTNGRNFDSQYKEFCRAKKPDNTDFLSSVAGDSSYGSNPRHPSIRWPKVGASVQVQIISAGKTVLPKMGFDENVYYVQAKAYNKTLSPSGRSEWIIATDYDHGFPSDQPAWLSTQLIRLYNKI